MQKDDYAAMAANTMAKHQYRCLVDTPELEVWECKRPDMGLMESFNLIIQTTAMAMIGDYNTVTFRVGTNYGLPFLAREIDNYYCEKLENIHEHEREYNVEKALGAIGWLAETWLEQVEIMPREGEAPLDAVARMAAEVKSMSEPHASDLYQFADFIKEARRFETDTEFYDALRNFGPVSFDGDYPGITVYTGNFMHRLHMIQFAARAILEIKNNKKEGESHGS